MSQLPLLSSDPNPQLLIVSLCGQDSGYHYQITDKISVQYNGLVPCITISTRSLVSYVVMIQSSLILKSTLSPTATISTSDTFCLNMAEYYCVNLVCISLLDLYRVCVSIHMIFVIIANLKLCSFYKMIILFYVPSFQEIF